MKLLFAIPFLALFLLLTCNEACATESSTSDDQGEQTQKIERRPSAAASFSSMESLDDQRKLEIGDRLSFRVIEDRRGTSQPIFITDSGEIEAPLVNRVMARGKTCRSLAFALKAILEKDYFYKATVIVALDSAAVRPKGRIWVNGMVNTTGPQEIPPDETFTLSKAIMRAGGVSQFGNDRKIKIVRKTDANNTVTMEVNLYEIMNKSRIDKDPVLKAGDLIMVPRKLINL